MNKLITFVVVMLFFLNTYSQENYIKLSGTENKCPIIIINDDIISNESFVNNKKQLIVEMSVLVDRSDTKNQKFHNLSENGVVFVEINKKIKAKSQCELNKFFGIPKKNKVYVNGYLIEHSDYKIATESIIEIELIEPNSTNKLKSKSINIWTLTKEERMNNCKK